MVGLANRVLYCRNIISTYSDHWAWWMRWGLTLVAWSCGCSVDAELPWALFGIL